METILRVLQVLLAVGLIGVVLLQRSEGGGLGIGSSGGMGSFMSVRGTANFLTRLTSILGGLFMLTCLGLALIAHPASAPRSIFDVPASTPTMPAPPASQAPPLPIPAPGEKPIQSGAAPAVDGGAAVSPSPATGVPVATPPPVTAVPPPSSAPLNAVPPVVATPTTEIPAAPAHKAPEHKPKKSAHKAAPQPSDQ